MQQWEYGYLYIVGMSVRGDGQRIPLTRSDRKIAVVLDATGCVILQDADNYIGALNILGRAGWIISDDRPGAGGVHQGWMYDLLGTAIPGNDESRVFIHEATYFMRRPIPEPAQ